MIECCICIKNFIAVLKLLTNLAGFICLCILVNLSSGDDDFDNSNEILGLSIATLTVICVYVVLGIIAWRFRKKKDKICFKVLAVIVLLLWIARYTLFIILMHFIETCNLDKKVRKKNKSKFNKLKDCFHAFAIIQIIVGAIEQVDNLIPDEEKLEEKIGYYY